LFKKIASIFLSVLYCLLFLVALLIIIFGTIAQKNHSIVKVFGYSYSVVATDSMEPTIMVGEIAIAKSTPFEEISQGDIIVFYSEDYEIYIIHRVHEILENGDLVTKGDNPSATIDEDPVTPENYFATVVKHGNFLNLGNLVLKYRSFVFVFIILIFVFIIVRELFSIAKQSKKTDEEKSKIQFEEQKQKAISEKKEQLRKEIIEEIMNERKK